MPGRGFAFVLVEVLHFEGRIRKRYTDAERIFIRLRSIPRTCPSIVAKLLYGQHVQENLSVLRKAESEMASPSLFMATCSTPPIRCKCLISRHVYAFL